MRFRTLRTLEEINQFETDVYFAWKRRQINDTEFMYLDRFVKNKYQSLFNGGNKHEKDN